MYSERELTLQEATQQIELWLKSKKIEFNLKTFLSKDSKFQIVRSFLTADGKKLQVGNGKGIGKEFSKHVQLTDLFSIPFYFPDPHAPWQRGSNENTNGLIREYSPKGQSLDNKTNDEIQEIVNKLNFRPKKCLGWRTPYEVYFSKVLHLI
ncbi:IS30 family transposase [Liquorilactobacillus nagelii]|nr:IS30 family transposase [Liquorilactobacillus nagelii]